MTPQLGQGTRQLTSGASLPHPRRLLYRLWRRKETAITGTSGPTPNKARRPSHPVLLAQPLPLHQASHLELELPPKKSNAGYALQGQRKKMSLDV